MRAKGKNEQLYEADTTLYGIIEIMQMKASL